jgi:hypothetical protein
MTGARARGNIMASMTDTFTTCAALVLATAAAVMSAPGQSDRTHEAARWLQSSFGVQADAIAGAIGEHPEMQLAP